MDIEEIIRDGLARYSYYASDFCIAAIANDIKQAYAEVEEKAWRYDEVSE